MLIGHNLCETERASRRATAGSHNLYEMEQASRPLRVAAAPLRDTSSARRSSRLDRATLVFLIVLSSGCATTLQHVALGSEVLAQGSLVCDGYSTHVGVSAGDYETNPIIRGQPDAATLTGYFGAASTLTFFSNRIASGALESHPNVANLLRIAMNTALFAVEVDAVQSNREQGVPTCGI